MIDSIKRLRERTSLSIAKIKKALVAADGDEDKALEVLKSENKDASLKRAGKGTEEGIIECYIHSNKKVGVLVELNSETDFVAMNSEFKELAHNLAMHIAAMDPEYLSVEDVPENLKQQGEDISLLTQKYIKDQDITIQELINNYISKLGENIKVGKFIRFEI